MKLSETLDRDAASQVFTGWLKSEHARVHTLTLKDPSIMSDLNAMRSATASEYDSYENIPARKTEQHLVRARLRLESLEDDYDLEIAGRGLSDILKLVAGQQVKRALAMSRTQAEFSSFATTMYLTTPISVHSACVMDVADPTESITPALDLLDFKVEGSLRAINQLSREGSDWGELNSPMTQAAWLGEVACIEAAFSAIEYVAARTGSYEAVPLRPPAKDDQDIEPIFPFQAAG